MTSSDSQLFVPTPMSSAFERRATPRRRVLLTGCLSDGRQETSLACGVRNLSAMGARIQLPAVDLKVKWGSLIVVRDARVYAIEPVWASGDQAGVQFLGSRSFSETPPRDVDPLRGLWLEMLPLSGQLPN